MNGAPFSLWTVYDRPSDYPNHFVARRFELDRPTDDVRIAPTLQALRATLPPGLVRIHRDPKDDPNIIEVWL